MDWLLKSEKLIRDMKKGLIKMAGILKTRNMRNGLKNLRMKLGKKALSLMNQSQKFEVDYLIFIIKTSLKDIYFKFQSVVYIISDVYKNVADWKINSQFFFVTCL